ncbi:D-xylose-binding periplasmic protein [Abditibacteriota bacterium]|nr:D-xylose-binding periplasmic protein [Abditibacteriota bacterium]
MSIRNVLMVVSLVLSVLIGLVVHTNSTSNTATASTSTKEKGSGKLLIGFSMDTLKEARWQVDRDSFVKRAKELGADVEVQSANSNDTQQMKDVNTLLTSGVQVLVIAAHDGKAMAKAVGLANKAGVPVIAYDRLIYDSNLDMYMSFDNEKVGELQAQYLVDHLPGGKGSIVCIYGSPADNNAKLFKKGQDKVLAPLIKRGDIKIVRADWAEDWKPENAKRIADAAITSGKFDAVLASNDGTAGGAIQALTEAKLSNVLVTGQDSELAACQRIARGAQSMSIYKPIKTLAAVAAECAVKMATGKPIVAKDVTNNGKIDVPSILENVDIVTKDNIPQTIVKTGFHSYDEVYGDLPANQRPPKP